MLVRNVIFDIVLFCLTSRKKEFGNRAKIIDDFKKLKIFVIFAFINEILQNDLQSVWISVHVLDKFLGNLSLTVTHRQVKGSFTRTIEGMPIVNNVQKGT